MIFTIKLLSLFVSGYVAGSAFATFLAERTLGRFILCLFAFGLALIVLREYTF